MTEHSAIPDEDDCPVRQIAQGVAPAEDEFDRNAPTRPLAEVMIDFRAELERRLASRA